MQDLPRIDIAIKDGSFEKNPALSELVAEAKKSGKACHVMGLMSPGGVHSHQKHISALCKILAKNGIKVFVHALMDGRDTPPTSGLGYVKEFEKDIAGLEGVRIATVSGRYYGMDRDKRWERVEKAYNAVVLAEGERFKTAAEAIEAAYKANPAGDEFIVPCIIGDYQGAEDGDTLAMANFRSDRAREILYALADDKFNSFARKKVVKFAYNLGMVEYSTDHNRFMKTMFEPQSLTNIYGEIISKHGMKQLRIAETEKYAHVTFFFNGGEEKEFAGEERILVPSPKVATYDLKPEMSVYEVTEKLVEAIDSGKFDTIICNFANGDMVGHTGILEAAIKAVEAVDECVGRTVAAIEKAGGVLLICADHGNCEMMKDPVTGEPYTAHTVGKIQAVLVNYKKAIKGMNDGRLADLAPTLLEILEIKQPAEMTGKSLLRF
jgi:2,3-bisphosphoglycerate-independent phosphoglycerate mutase